jgi:hypothetical protein
MGESPIDLGTEPPPWSTFGCRGEVREGCGSLLPITFTSVSLSPDCVFYRFA